MGLGSGTRQYSILTQLKRMRRNCDIYEPVQEESLTAEESERKYIERKESEKKISNTRGVKKKAPRTQTKVVAVAPKATIKRKYVKNKIFEKKHRFGIVFLGWCYGVQKCEMV